VNYHLVYSDVQSIIFNLTNQQVNANELLQTFLCRSDTHIAEMAIQYRTCMGNELETVIRMSSLKVDMKKVLVHAIRTASNIVYRDVMLLRDAMGYEYSTLVGEGSCETLGIRATRMHWFNMHWNQVKVGYKGIAGRDFVTEMEQLKTRKDEHFGDLMLALARC
jgi:hypothetical protein